MLFRKEDQDSLIMDKTNIIFIRNSACSLENLTQHFDALLKEHQFRQVSNLQPFEPPYLGSCLGIVFSKITLHNNEKCGFTMSLYAFVNGSQPVEILLLKVWSSRTSQALRIRGVQRPLARLKATVCS
jgi:hypothetical protein